jgi:hypothetical protein
MPYKDMTNKLLNIKSFVNITRANHFIIIICKYFLIFSQLIIDSFDGLFKNLVT